MCWELNQTCIKYFFLHNPPTQYLLIFSKIFLVSDISIIFIWPDDVIIHIVLLTSPAPTISLFIKYKDKHYFRQIVTTKTFSKLAGLANALMAPKIAVLNFVQSRKCEIGCDQIANLNFGTIWYIAINQSGKCLQTCSFEHTLCVCQFQLSTMSVFLFTHHNTRSSC